MLGKKKKENSVELLLNKKIEMSCHRSQNQNYIFRWKKIKIFQGL